MNNEKLIFLIKKIIEGNDLFLKITPCDRPMHLFHEGRNTALEWVLKLLIDEDLLEQTYNMNVFVDSFKSENK